ncbi:uncharacterized protein RB166_017247 [Leptodactylus fuscus]|uniref:uncharacterized protein LOC142218074 n=1 Tax=Leptodactylus fuscus TaxID=238119 RepID=UPI003F4E8270
MTSRRRAGNPDNLQPEEPRQYQLRNRRVGAPSYSVSAFTSERDPPPPGPDKKDETVEQSEKSLYSRRTTKSSKYEGSMGDISGFVRPSIRNAGKEKKEDTAEQNVKSISLRRTTELSKYEATPDSDDYSEEGSEYSNSNRRGLPESDRRAESSAERQPSQPRQLSKYTDDDTGPSIRSPTGTAGGDEKETRHYQHETRSVKKTTLSQTRQLIDVTNDKDKTSYIRGEDWRGSTQRSYFSPEGRGKESFLNARYQQTPRENAKSQPANPKAQLFSDDEEEKEGIAYQKQKAYHPELDLKNHYPAKKIELKGVQKIESKPHTKSFICFSGTCMIYLFGVLLLVLVGSATVYHTSPESFQKIAALLFEDEPLVKQDLKDDFEKLGSVFTNQSPLLWNRSRRILERHLENQKGNTEPAIILLTGAMDAEQTLLCLSTQLAKIYSSACNRSHTVISGSDWASKSSEEVKEHIDGKLSAGFQATTRAAVLHRLEVLPAGSLLILYKYCDHESAVYKNVALVLTVLLQDPTLDKEIPLANLEEKVREFLIQKLTISDNKATHDGMDKDKFSGVWSRISHVVLPVFPDQNAEQCAK